MEKKYELTDESKRLRNGSVVYRIKALREFSDVKAGDLGGFIEKEENLSHEGNCWVYDDSQISNIAKVTMNAKIRCNSIVGHNARVRGDAIVENYSKIYDSAVVDGFSIINHGKVADYAIVGGNSEILDNAIIAGSCMVRGNQIMGAVMLTVSIDSDTNIIKNKGSETILITHNRKEIIESIDYVKYELTDITKVTNHGKTVLHRIKALKDFGNVKAGDLGGWIEKYDNLSQEGDCWVYDEAEVYDNALVDHNAVVEHRAKVYGRAGVLNNAVISDGAEVFHYAHIKDQAIVSGNALVYNDAWVCGTSEIKEGGRVCNDAAITNIIVDGNDIVRDKIYSRTQIRLCNVKSEERINMGNNTVQKKYELTDETIVIDGTILHRIKALKDFKIIMKNINNEHKEVAVYAGNLGGWVEKEENLSQEGNCWIGQDAVAMDNAKVIDNAVILNDDTIIDNAVIKDDTTVANNAYISGNAIIKDSAYVYDCATIGTNATVKNCAKVRNHAVISGHAVIGGDSIITDHAQISGSVHITGTAVIQDDARIIGNIIISGGSIISGATRINPIN